MHYVGKSAFYRKLTFFRFYSTTRPTVAPSPHGFEISFTICPTTVHEHDVARAADSHEVVCHTRISGRRICLEGYLRWD
jgi:hypothetical protein